MLSLLPVLLLGAAAVVATPLQGLTTRDDDLSRRATVPEACEFAFGTVPNSFKSDFSRIVTFGDSSTDSGRAYQITGGVSPPAFYYNHTFSNGPVYPVLLSQRLGVDLLGCAIGGATSNNTRAPGTIANMTVPSGIDQVNSYLAALPGSKGNKNKIIKDRLHIILVGQNNINANPRATGADAVEDIKYAVGKLVDAGATRILLFTSTDLGRNTPYALLAPQLTPLLTAWAVSFRNALFATYGPYGAKNEDKKVAVVDVYALANLLNDSYEQFGLNEATRGVPCVFPGQTTVCADPEKRMFWDQLHPSARLHSLLAAAALAAMKAKGWVSSA